MEILFLLVLLLLLLLKQALQVPELLEQAIIGT